MKKDVPIEIEIEVVEPASRDLKNQGRSPLVLLGSGPSLYLVAPVACPQSRAWTHPLPAPVCFYGCVNTW